MADDGERTPRTTPIDVELGKETRFSSNVSVGLRIRARDGSYVEARLAAGTQVAFLTNGAFEKIEFIVDDDSTARPRIVD